MRGGGDEEAIAIKHFMDFATGNCCGSEQRPGPLRHRGEDMDQRLPSKGNTRPHLRSSGSSIRPNDLGIFFVRSQAIQLLGSGAAEMVFGAPTGLFRWQTVPVPK